jgi:hypothetical protein
MKVLYLEDLKDQSEVELIDHIVRNYEASKEEVEKMNILIAYESVGSWGCDSSAFFLLEEKESKQLYEVHASHCSCYGFEGQWKPEVTSAVYLLDKANNGHLFYTGGYDDYSDDNKKAAIEWVKNNLPIVYKENNKENNKENKVKTFAFYGVCGNRYKLDDKVWEAKEDPSDGYRSYLGSIEIVNDSTDIFYKTPLAIVRVEKFDDTNSNGYKIIDMVDEFVWLIIGTGNTDDYYPYFIFEYHAKQGTLSDW